ncbi:MAG: cardiolipin synthase [Eubacteriales bacterium]
MNGLIGIIWLGIEFFMEHLVFINCFLSVIIIFFQQKEPKSVWAWLLILYAIPMVGFLFYILFGTDLYRKRMFKTKEIKDRLQEIVKEQELYLRSHRMAITNPNLKEYEDLVYYNLESSNAIYTTDNEVRHIIEGREKFELLIKDMQQAKKYIHMQYYIVKNDLVFQEIEKVLEKKVTEGVEVRILLDGMGSRTITKKYRNYLAEKGIEIAVFFKPLFGKLHLRLNYRNHRKIVVIDGHIGYIGGYNIGKEYISLDKKFGNWRDTHIRIEGTAVVELAIRFILDWNYTKGVNLFETSKYLQMEEETIGKSELQIVSSGPDSSLKNIRNNYLRLIAKAKERILIQTPYFIPDEEMMSALMIAIYSGVEVNIMIPCKPDHLFVYWATYSYIGELIISGANCYSYEKGFLHAKGMVVDGKVYCYGTANMDIRSFRLNFEVNVVNYTKEDAKKMEETFYEDLKNCRKITKEEYKGRSIVRKFKEHTSRLFSPLL